MATVFEKWQDALRMKIENIALHFETQILRELERQTNPLRIHGSQAEVLLGCLLSQSNSPRLQSLPHLVVLPSQKNVEEFVDVCRFFQPGFECIVLPPWDVSPYSGLSVAKRISAARSRFFYQANILSSSAKGKIFVSSVPALLQRTIPFKEFAKNRTSLRLGGSLDESLFKNLELWGYDLAPYVEDVGQFSRRGGIVDIFSPAHDQPIRIELFGDQIESMRFFQPTDQLTTGETAQIQIIPVREIIWNDFALDNGLTAWRKTLEGRAVESSDVDEVTHHWSRGHFFDSLDFALPYFQSETATALDHFNSEVCLWLVDPEELGKASDLSMEAWKSEFESSPHLPVRPSIDQIFLNFESLDFSIAQNKIEWSPMEDPRHPAHLEIPSRQPQEILAGVQAHPFGTNEWRTNLHRKLHQLRSEGERVFFICKNQSQLERLKSALDSMEFQTQHPPPNEWLWHTWCYDQDHNESLLHLVIGDLPRSERWPEEKIIFLRANQVLGKVARSRELTSKEEFEKKAKWMSFGDLKPGDCIVHKQHGIGVYQGLKLLDIQGVSAELLQISYRDNDKLYLPVYRLAQIQKYSGHAQTAILDKLGGGQWEKTKAKVKDGVRDIARDLLTLYAQRQELHRAAFQFSEQDMQKFEAAFPFEETPDQDRAISSILKDLRSTRPMDRLICGDVGFGKTEVAMRAAFACLSAGMQVAVLAPTTVLTFQHEETFKKRFAGWNFNIRALNRFVSTADSKKILAEIKDGKCQMLIGTHRLLSKDIEFQNLGLLIIDEEQKFGVAHKEKLRRMKKDVDTISLSATPIPRTLNMSLLGIRDLSLINSAPAERLPTRTFVTKWNDDLIRKGILSEIQRGGQVFFIHNRIQSIYGVADDLRQIVPEARIQVAHGQQPEDQLESTMIDFFHHKMDVLLCTAIVESGIDNPKANTMFIDQAHQLGLSQLYQLRGRVGRSKQRAFCYLLMPKNRKLDDEALSRLKVLQDNSALGSGIRIAQYDLELRGAGEILGENQSGHIDSVGFEMYQDLLQQTLGELKGNAASANEDIEPEINLRIPALLPESYVPDVRMRLSYYKALTDIENAEDVDKIEEELKDQFGPLPDAAVNLLGLMLIRRQCKTLGIKDLSAGLKNISLLFSSTTPLKTETAVKLAMKENKKYALTQDQRLNIRLNQITWPAVYEELNLLLRLIP